MGKEREYEYCLRCGRKLKSLEAKKIGYGPICLQKLKTDAHFRKLFNMKI